MFRGENKKLVETTNFFSLFWWGIVDIFFLPPPKSSNLIQLFWKFFFPMMKVELQPNMAAAERPFAPNKEPTTVLQMLCSFSGGIAFSLLGFVNRLEHIHFDSKKRRDTADGRIPHHLGCKKTL